MKINLVGECFEMTDNTRIAELPQVPEAKGFDEVVCAALDHPLDLQPLAQWDLRGKRVAIMVDDWGRPTPCGDFLPSVLDRLNAAGAADDHITIVTASGMHDPMDDDRMIAKVGLEAFRRVRCISHDGGNESMLAFCGVTPMGTPVWVNRYVAEADFKMAFGRIYPHTTYGYEGGYKMIVPGVASFETIVRDHSLNYSSFSDYGIVRDNPSRGEADAVGRLVGIDFLVNYVMNWSAQPVIAYGGTVERVFAAGVGYGQHHVWAATSGKPADITITCHKELGDLSLSNNPSYYVGLAKTVTRPGGIVISTMQYQPQKCELIMGMDLMNMPIGEVIRLHEKRDWNLTRRQIQHVIKSIRGVYYFRREFELRPQRLFPGASGEVERPPVPHRRSRLSRRAGGAGSGRLHLRHQGSRSYAAHRGLRFRRGMRREPCLAMLKSAAATCWSAAPALRGWAPPWRRDAWVRTWCCWSAPRFPGALSAPCRGCP